MNNDNSISVSLELFEKNPLIKKSFTPNKPLEKGSKKKDVLQKGHLRDLRYLDAKVKKKGSEVKTAINQALAVAKTKMESLKTELDLAKEELQEQGVKFVDPTKSALSRGFDGNEAEVSSTSNQDNQILRQMCWRYNDLAWEYNRMKDEVKVGEEALSMFEDNKQYEFRFGEWLTLVSGDGYSNEDGILRPVIN